jgi:ubiquinone/menaquinone biosynthesis C-methylase UbiE
MLVAGGPWSNRGIRRWLNMPAHGGGDVCLDIERRAFEGHPRGLIADVTQIPFSDKAFGAVFASHLLEHLPTTYSAKKAVDELNRVAEAVFIVYPSRQSVGAWLHRGHHLWVWQKGNTIYIEQRNNSKGEKRPRCILVDTVNGVSD